MSLPSLFSLLEAAGYDADHQNLSLDRDALLRGDPDRVRAWILQLENDLKGADVNGPWYDSKLAAAIALEALLPKGSPDHDHP